MNNLIFGPVPSRRFGMSLGIDLSPNAKQCNFDCLYCELSYAKTLSKQIDVISVEEIMTQLKISLKNHKNIDVITFTANGEPTLYPHLSELIDEIDKIKGNMKTLILSNGANIYKPEMQQTLSKIDIVKLSLDCVSAKCFQKLDRIDSSVDCSKIVSGMVEFRKLHKKQLVLETLFVKTLNDNDQEIAKLHEAVKLIQPNRIDIGTIDRPPAYSVQPITHETLISIADKLEGLPVTIAHKNKIVNKQSFDKSEIITLLSRRPLTFEDVENTFDEQSLNLLHRLSDDGEISIVNNNGVKFYKI
ncbi:radical SAM protein [Arcobacteraceae bacterium]|nr:radical SAM protein [Arcobacteraceae bacterium]